MAKLTARDEWLQAQCELEAAKRAAGLENILKDLNQRNAFIASAEENNEEVRQIVFAVPDRELRRQIIHFSRECHRLCRATHEQELLEYQDRQRSGGEHIRRDALWGAVFLGVGAVVLGNYLWSNTGALIGAVVAALVGFDNIRRAERAAVADVEAAKREACDEAIFLGELGSKGTYSKTEEMTGQPDT